MTTCPDYWHGVVTQTLVTKEQPIDDVKDVKEINAASSQTTDLVAAITLATNVLLPEDETVSTTSPSPLMTVGSHVIRGRDWKWRDQDGGIGSVGTVESMSPWSGVEQSPATVKEKLQVNTYHVAASFLDPRMTSRLNIVNV